MVTGLQLEYNVITIFPSMFNSLGDNGVIGRAIKRKLIKINQYQLRDFSDNAYKSIDDAPYGGGAGMIMQVKPIRDCINHIKKINDNTKIIYLSPQGKRLNHGIVLDLAKCNNITLLCGRYEGIDQRIIDSDIDLELSIGDYVLSGGELAAMVLIDAVSRQLPGVLGNSASLQDSFFDNKINYPQYTRPQIIDGQKVPDVLLSGNQKLIDEWREQQKKIATLKFNDINN